MNEVKGGLKTGWLNLLWNVELVMDDLNLCKGHATLCASHETSWDSAMIFKCKSNELLKICFAVKLLDKELALVLSQSFNTISMCSLLAAPLKKFLLFAITGYTFALVLGLCANTFGSVV